MSAAATKIINCLLDICINYNKPLVSIIIGALSVPRPAKTPRPKIIVATIREPKIIRKILDMP